MGENLLEKADKWLEKKSLNIFGDPKGEHCSAI